MSKYDNLKLDNQICFSLYAVSREIIKLYKPILDELKLTYTQYLVMLVLWEENKATVKHLGNRLHLDSGTLTPLLKKLESMELIEKYRSKEDDRVVFAELTSKGRELQEKSKDVPNKVLCNMNFSEDKIKQLKEGIDELLFSLKK
ncbi:MarR family winged helix-turn-helix transcriptional regulator [Clostridium sp.]|uniref:MarR family winged helix-turn-helix transcriptional regulator n=1 Tax=Clostridium sp. TaxID=1506 RepID=UPI001D3E29C5|nr:MarR family transcriptional regulator [Clostridium sp.]MBS5937570.1 MarR family transcriptional regulator [Clostridium sp.]